jgi:hypothetical protein
MEEGKKQTMSLQLRSLESPVIYVRAEKPSVSQAEQKKRRIEDENGHTD